MQEILGKDWPNLTFGNPEICTIALALFVYFTLTTIQYLTGQYFIRVLHYILIPHNFHFTWL